MNNKLNTYIYTAFTTYQIKAYIYRAAFDQEGANSTKQSRGGAMADIEGQNVIEIVLPNYHMKPAENEK